MMLGSQGIGLITVIAVSGCSVMLLVLGRQKLLELKKDSSCQGGGLESHSCEVQQHTEGGTPISWRMNLGKRDYGKLGSDGLWKFGPTAPFNGSQSSPDKKRNLVKKVRFSEDVVEPSGDNVAYRRRHALALNPGQHRSRKPDNTCCQNKRIDYSKSDAIAKPRRVLANIPPNRMALYIGICNDRSRRGLLHL